jgi:hypothetical protein
MSRFLLNFPDEGDPTRNGRKRVDKVVAIIGKGVQIVVLGAALLVLFQITGGDWNVNRIREMIPAAAKVG